MYLRLTPPAKPGKNRHTSQNNQQAIQRIRPVFPEGVVEQKGGDGNEQRGNHGIAEHTVGSCSQWVAPAEDKDRAPGDHIEEPLRENCERKELPETPAQQQEMIDKNACTTPPP